VPKLPAPRIVMLSGWLVVVVEEEEEEEEEERVAMLDEEYHKRSGSSLHQHSNFDIFL